MCRFMQVLSLYWIDKNILMSVIVSCKLDIDLSEVFPNFELSLANESTGNLEKEKIRTLRYVRKLFQQVNNTKLDGKKNTHTNILIV